MRISAVILENFRCYRSRIRIPLDDLTAFVGKNDAGKSTVLEALEIFFNSDSVKFEAADKCVYTEGHQVRIGCALSDLPSAVVVDERVATTLGDEYLLNESGELEIHQVFDCNLKNPKPKPFAIANHPTSEGFSDLLGLKINELKTRAEELGVDLAGVDQRVSSAIRAAIWAASPDLALSNTEISLEKEDGKKIWDTLKKQLPVFALFQSDRPSRDGDPEVQDPMKMAIKEALREVTETLDGIKRKVREHATDVANRTLEKLRDLDPELASELIPDFSSEPKWDSLFKLTLTGEDGIPINKRGSGVRRLILLSFFRAEAERRKHEAAAPGIVYAIEEPETSQHPANQRALIRALSELSELGGVQVILTTHVPALAGLIPTGCLRYVVFANNGDREVTSGSEDVSGAVAQSLGVLPDPRTSVEVLVYVEGTNDVAFLTAVSRTMADQDEHLPPLGEDPRVAFVPTGGSSLKAWVEGEYLKGLGRPEIHLYDRDHPDAPKYQQDVDRVNQRGDGSFAKLTDKRALENYLDAASIIEAYRELGVAIELPDVGDWDDVPATVAEVIHAAANPQIAWQDLDEEKQSRKVSRAKRVLNRQAAGQMTCERLEARGGYEELRAWLAEVANRFQ